MHSAFYRACVVILLSGSCAFAQSEKIEPEAGTWKTWVISSGKEMRVPPPPDNSATELEELRKLVTNYDAQATARITFWDAGSPGYRWIELVNDRILDNQQIPNTHRVYTYLTMAIHDATVAAWESKYFYNRPRPSETDATLPTALPTPRKSGLSI